MYALLKQGVPSPATFRDVIDRDRTDAMLKTGSSVVYQEFFGFDRRPFPTHGSTTPLVPTPATDEALPLLERCAREGRGIAILSAPTGTGKTAVVLEVGRRLSETLHVVYLSSSKYSSRRGLLQAILFELGVAYAGLSEQEARLQVIEFSRGLLPDRDGIALLVDEADQLSEELLDELRALANYMHEGRPLLRLVLCGQLALDERLTAPEMDTFNQRVGCQVVLESLDRKQSADYIRATLAACGAEVEAVFSGEALDLICAASDGNVRCLHHLCDHALLLAFVAEEKPVTATTVRSALEDLQGLPLAWQVPAAAQSALTTEPDGEPIAPAAQVGGHSEDTIGPASPEPAGEAPPSATQTQPDAEQVETTVIEFGGDVLHETPVPQGPESKQLDDPGAMDSADSGSSHSIRREYRLEDRYAELDRLKELERPNAPPHTVAESGGDVSTEPDGTGTASGLPARIPLPDTTARPTVEEELLAEIADMRAEVRQVSSCQDATDELPAPDHRGALPSDVSNDEAEWDVIQPEPEDNDVSPVVETGWNDEQTEQSESADETSSGTASCRFAEIPARQGVESGMDGEDRQNSRERIDTDDRTRRYAFLFTRLRNRRRDLATRSGS